MAEVIPPAVMAEVAQGEARMVEVLQLCAKGRECGYDMSAQEAVATALRDRLQAIRVNFPLDKRKST